MANTLEKKLEHIKTHVTKVVNDYANKNHLTVSEEIINNLSVHLSLSITRALSDNYIHTSHSQLEQCKNLYTYPIAKEIINDLCKHYEIELSESDLYNTAMYLADMTILDLGFDAEFDIVDQEIENIMDETLDTIRIKLGYNLRENEKFVRGMSLHFYPAIDRLEEDRQITDNPLMQTVQKYKKSYECAHIMNDIVKRHFNKSFNSYELSYIAIHFQTAFDARTAV